ncbi:NAD(P)/FAD-dependent oxidoreductase [uncultured Jatrophihabitans sp.]|uniref:NAD(P)/FAD-dependent oxidoreductase n=1 Tax=uncultured Jatrophihabitans sp. TaxID=1610747 RepID=UPI0035CAD258
MSPASNGPVVVVGAGLSGSRTCTELRKSGHVGPIVLIGDEPSLPYDRPPLSKAVLRGKREPKPLKADYEGLRIDVRLATRVVGVDLTARTLTTEAETLEFESLVVATGAKPLRVPGAGEQLVLRTDLDAITLRDRLEPGARIVVIGASWIGAEVAHAAVEKGCSVTGLEYQDAPLAMAFGAQIGARFAAWWEGATLRTGVRVESVEPDGVHLSSGEVVAADAVVTGIGVRACTDWLIGSGLALLPEVAVDDHLRASVPGVYAVGDVAAWWSRRYGRRLRIQHWHDASSGPAIVADGIVNGAGAELVHDPVPYFWSDQFGHRVEYVGHHGAEDDVTVEDLESGWSARWRDRSGRLTAALATDQPELIAGLRKQVLTEASADGPSDLIDIAG